MLLNKALSLPLPLFSLPLSGLFFFFSFAPDFYIAFPRCSLLSFSLDRV